jgi:hypothetical protein
LQRRFATRRQQAPETYNLEGILKQVPAASAKGD